MKFLAGLFSLAVLALVIGLGAGLWLLNDFSRDLPDHSLLADYRPPVLSRVYSGDGRPVAVFAAEQRQFVPISAIPRPVIAAFLSAEDKDFYHHQGIDPSGIARAVLINLQNLGGARRPVGASTITQQVAKNFLLGNEVSMKRKLREMLLAMRIEQALNKDRILELYLNQIFLGQRSYGVATAALNYFNKSLDNLTIAEAAYLASLPKAPNNYNIQTNHDAALARRNWVIGRMLEDGAITAADAATARAEPLVQRQRAPEETVSADYFTEEVRRILVDQFGSKAVLEGGLTVRTSLSPDLQNAAAKALRKTLLDYDRQHSGWRGAVGRLTSFSNWTQQLSRLTMPPGGEIWRLAAVLAVDANGAAIGFADGSRGGIPWSELTWARPRRSDGSYGAAPRHPREVLSEGEVVMVEALPSPEPNAKAPAPVAGLPLYTLRQVPLVQGALVAIDPHTGRILAIEGGFSARISSFNRATQAWRQPGSAFKPFVYLAALDSGFSPASLVMDAPVSFEQGPGMPLWQPENYGDKYYGPTTLRVGLEKSRNIITVRLAHHLGMNKIVSYAKAFGIADDMPELLSFALGAKETTPLRLTTAYAMLVNGGRRVQPSFIDQVQDRDGRTVWRQDSRPCPDCKAATYLSGAMPPALPDARAAVADPRTVYQIVSMLEGVASRGTAAGALASFGRPIAGKTGTTNDSKDAWFIGFTPDLVTGVFIGYDEPKSLGGHETGASLAVPVFRDFMAAATAGTQPVPFRVPPGVRLVRVNSATGRPSKPGEKGTIWEAFLPGTEPDPTITPAILEEGITPGQPIGGGLGGGQPNAASPDMPSGTGGLY